MLEYAAPPGYRRQLPVRRPKLGTWIGVIDPILEDDKPRSPKAVRHREERFIAMTPKTRHFT
jgi:hypothetical protein